MPPLPPNLKDWADIATPVFAILAGLAAGWKALHEIGLGRAQRAIESETRQRQLEQSISDQRWRQALQAKQLIDEMFSNQHVLHVVHMLDWPGDDLVEVGADEVRTVHKVTRSDFRAALARPKEKYSRKEQFICECFDDFFYYLAKLEHSVGSGLVPFDDVRFPTDYYVSLLSNDKDVVLPYLDYYGLDLAAAFLMRLDVWVNAEAKALPGFDDVSSGSVVAGDSTLVERDGRHNRLRVGGSTESPSRF